MRSAMRGLMFGVVSAAGLAGCWGPVDQTSPKPGASVPPAARGAEVKALCKANPDSEHDYCKQMKAAASAAPASAAPGAPASAAPSAG